MKQCLFIAVFAVIAAGCNKSAEKQTYSLETCKVNLRMIDDAEQTWAEQRHKTAADIPTSDDLRAYLRGGFPKCPDGGTYTLGHVGEPPACSIPAHTAYFKKLDK